MKITTQTIIGLLNNKTNPLATKCFIIPHIQFKNQFMIIIKRFQSTRLQELTVRLYYFVNLKKKSIRDTLKQLCKQGKQRN